MIYNVFLKKEEMHGVGNKLKEIWTMDERQQLESFQKDQATNGKICHSNISYTRMS